MSKIALIGLSPSTHDLAPWGDEGFELWGMPWDREGWVSLDRFFEMHSRETIEMRPHDLRRLQEIDWGPVYMQQAHGDIPCSEPFPFYDVNRDVFAGFPRAAWGHRRQEDWYACTISYMLTLAIHQSSRGDVIGLWGVDVNEDSEYAHQRSCLEFLIGLAIGRGIEVIIPEGPTALGQFGDDGKFPRRYGYTEEKTRDEVYA